MADMKNRRQVICDGKKIEYSLTRKQIKNIYLRVKTDGSVVVSANKQVPVTYIDDFILSKSTYILKALDKYEEGRKEETSPKQYISGECFKILGIQHTLKVIEGKAEMVAIDSEFIYLTVNDKNSFVRKKKLLISWMREFQLETFHQICREVYPIFQKYGCNYPEVKVRDMSSRWGSCRPQKGSITLNSKLIEEPKRCVEYVVLHEFSHFIYPNHSKQFYDFVAVHMPDWKERKELLKSY
ncbi:MAG: M48 family metallopeptidase [Velocimicrobium sp.]